MAGKLYEMKFVLGATQGQGFKSTFSQAQAEFARLGNEIQSLNKTQSDISAYQKQSAAIDSTKAKIANLTKQHELLSQQIQNTTGDTSGLQMEQLKLEQRMASAQGALERQEGKLSATSQRLEEAGVNTADLAGESARLTAQIEELSKEQEQAAQSAQEYGDSAVGAFQAAGEALAAAGIVAGIKEIGAAYIGTVQAAGEFGATMSNVEALSGANASQMAALTAQAKELGATTKFTANESGEAMGYMGMAGWNAQQMLAGMPGVLDLAAASGEDLAGVSDIVTDALTGFGLTAADTGQFVDVLATASTKSNTNVGLLGESFKYVAPLCGTLGYSAEDAAVSLGLMANAGIKGSQAGTTLKTAIANLAAPTEKQAAEMKRLHISLTDAGDQMLPMLDLVGNLRGAFSGMSEAEQSAAASTIFGKEAMSGMLAIINASEADYQSLTQSIYNSAGAAERMANIKLDNLAGDLTLLQSAADGLSLSIGEQFMPQARGLVQAGTSVITFVNELIDQHPVLTKVVLGAAGAVGVLTAGVVAYNAAQSVMAALNLASLFAGPVGPILAVGAALGAVVGGVIAFVNAANEGVPKVDELTRAAQEAAGAMEEVSVDFDQSRVNIAATADVAGMYIDRLDQLGAKTGLTSAESTEYHNILQLLCDTVPDLAESIDLTTDSIEGGTDALRAQTEAWQKNAEAQAYQEAYYNLLGDYNQVQVEAKENTIRLTEAQNKLRAMEEERASALRELQEMEADPALYDPARYAQLDQQLRTLNNDLFDQVKVVDAYQKAVDKSNAAAEEAKAATEGYAQAMAGLTGESQEAARAMDSFSRSADQLTNNGLSQLTGGLIGVGATFAGTLGQVTEDYYEVYHAAYDSISGQMGLFEQMSVSADTSVGKMSEALESQAAYMAQYSENLRAAFDLGLDETLLAQLSDGSTESAAYLQAIVSGGEEAVDEINTKFQEVEKGKEAFANTVRDLQVDVDKTMTETTQCVERAVQEMDLHAEALESSQNTFQGLIEGANSMMEPVRIAYRNVALGALAALQTSMNAGLSVTRGYAAGTTDAEPGFAMVGENGPELVFFQGGEQVVNATQTAAMQRQSALTAAPSGGYGGEPMVIQIYFQFEGSATPEAVAQLREYGAEFEARVRQVMEDCALDSARRRY